MNKRTISWKCTTGPAWEWKSGGEGNPGISTADDTVREGTINLPPNPDYWYPCIELVLQGVTTGNACLRYFKDKGVDKVQAMTVAQGEWIEYGKESESYSSTNAGGGINLLVQFA